MFSNFGKRKNFKSTAINTYDGIDNKLYFGETKNIHNTRAENLKLIKNIFEKHNIRYCLLFGTLLGQYRENDFIEGDCDDDLYIDKKHINDFNDNMLKDLENEGFYWLRSWSNKLITIGRDGRYIDLCFLGNHSHIKYKDYYHYSCNNFYHKKYFDDEFKIGKLNGESYPVINNSKGFLEACYGPDFMIKNNNGYYINIVKWIE